MKTLVIHPKDITTNQDFALAIKESIDFDDMLDKAKSLYEGNSPVVEFNRSNLYYK